MLYERSGTSGSPDGEADRRLQALINEFDVPVCLAQDGKIRMINTRGLDMSGYTHEEILSCDPIKLFAHPDDVPEVLANHEMQMQGRMLHKPYVVRIVTKTGDVRWMDIKSIPLPWHGKTATLNFYYDLTDILSGDVPERKDIH